MVTAASDLPDPDSSCPELTDHSDNETIDNPLSDESNSSDGTIDTTLSDIMDVDVDSSISDWETESGSSSDEAEGSE